MVPSDSPSPSATPAPVVDDEATGDGGWARLAGAALLVLVAAGVIVWLRRRDASGPGGDDAAPADSDGSTPQD